MCGQSRSNSCACSSGAVAELCNYPASDSTVPSLGVLLPCAELGREEKERNVREGAKIISSDDPAFFALPPAQFVNAMPTCQLTHPRAKGIFLILFLEDDMKFQEDFCRGILSVFWLAKEPTANVQDEGIVRGMN